MRRHLITILALSILISYGCATKTYKPGPSEEVPFQERAQSKNYRGVRVTAAVLSQQECKDVFGLDLYKKDIQPVWLVRASAGGPRTGRQPRRLRSATA